MCCELPPAHSSFITNPPGVAPRINTVPRRHARSNGDGNVEPTRMRCRQSLLPHNRSTPLRFAIRHWSSVGSQPALQPPRDSQPGVRLFSTDDVAAHSPGRRTTPRLQTQVGGASPKSRAHVRAGLRARHALAWWRGIPSVSNNPVAPMRVQARTLAAGSAARAPDADGGGSALAHGAASRAHPTMPSPWRGHYNLGLPGRGSPP